MVDDAKAPEPLSDAALAPAGRNDFVAAEVAMAELVARKLGVDVDGIPDALDDALSRLRLAEAARDELSKDHKRKWDDSDTPSLYCSVGGYKCPCLRAARAAEEDTRGS